MIKILLSCFCLLINTLIADEAILRATDRGNWTDETINTTRSSEPSDLKYFQYFDVMPDEITLKVFDHIDMSELGNKKLYIGYGVADPKGDNCKIYRAVDTGLPNDVSICLPWWRIEREYISNDSMNGQVNDMLISELRRNTKPPIVYRTCKEYQDAISYLGGNTTCTSYYDRKISQDCWDNPEQSKCFVNNCGTNIVEKCTRIDSTVGDVEKLGGAVVEEGSIVEESTKYKLVSHMYYCENGSVFDKQDCTDEEENLVFPYECEPESTNPDGSINEGENIYCDEERPVFDGGSNVIGFLGTCSDGREVQCEVNKLEHSKLVCKEPIVDTTITTELREINKIRSYTEHSVDVLSGEPDSYSALNNCIRSNTVEDSRDATINIKINGSGSLDDDIYVLNHEQGGSFSKIYCNMQHAAATPAMTDNMNTCLSTKGFTIAPEEQPTVVADLLSCTNDVNNFSPDFVKSCLELKGYTDTRAFTSSAIQNIYSCGEIIKGGNATKIHDGIPLSCLRNSGNYSFNETVTINNTDIVSIQQNSEAESVNGTPFALGRRHYSSTNVTIDGVTAAPDTFPGNHPYYPRYESHLRTWDNTTSTLSIMFPFAGAYELFFYNKNNNLMAQKSLDISDFSEMNYLSATNLKLGQEMDLVSGMDEASAGRDDSWVEWGGGVYGGKDSKTGDILSVPNDDYVKANAVYKVLVKDIINGSITPIKLVYPLPYPNRVYISKLKVYEKRKYRCYGSYSDSAINPSGDTKFMCSTNEDWNRFQNGSLTSLDEVQQWQDQSTCEQNCKTYNTCSAITKNIAGVNKSGFTCLSKGGEDLGGDIEGNMFSSEIACNTKCFVQNSCDTYTDNGCTLVEEKETSNITDYTGKTVSTEKLATYKCVSRNDVQTGCAKYGIIIDNQNVDFNYLGVGNETKDFSQTFEEAAVKVSMVEVGSQHIWSGWRGKCVKGMKWDFSYLSDPMTLMSYAMSAYSSMNSISSATTGAAEASVTTANEAANTAQSSLDALKEAGATAQEIADATAQLNAAQATLDQAVNSYVQVSNTTVGSLANKWEGFKDTISTTYDSAYNSTMEATGLGNVVAETEKVASNISTKILDGYDTVTDNIAEGYNGLAQGIGKSLGMDLSSIQITPDITSSATDNLTAIKNGQIATVEQGVELAQNSVTNTSLMQSAKETLKEFTSIDWDASVISSGSNYINVTQGDIVMLTARTAFIASAPQESDYILAERMMSSYSGLSDNSSTTQAYNSCMTSIGAGLPNLIGWSSGESPSSELLAPWEHALRMTPAQLASIATVTSENYVMSHYLIDAESRSISLYNANNVLTNVVAISADAYLKATQTICMGIKVAQASEHISSENASGGDGGISAGDVGMMAAKMALSTVCPPCGFALSIITDLYTNALSNINTCDSLPDAMEYDLLHLKTNKFVNQGQCQFVESYCDKETSLMGCVRTGYEYCCYDQLTTKVFAQGLKDQMYPSDMPIKEKWASCSDITIDSLKDISFNECEEGQDPYEDKCFALGRYSEFQQVLFRSAAKGISVEGLTDQVMNSMAIETD